MQACCSLRPGRARRWTSSLSATGKGGLGPWATSPHAGKESVPVACPVASMPQAARPTAPVEPDWGAGADFRAGDAILYRRNGGRLPLPGRVVSVDTSVQPHSYEVQLLGADEQTRFTVRTRLAHQAPVQASVPTRCLATACARRHLQRVQAAASKYKHTMQALCALLLLSACVWALHTNGSFLRRKAPLLTAATAGNLKLVSRLLDAGDNPNLGEFHALGPIAFATHMTPLHAAAVNGHEATVKSLLLRGARASGARTLCAVRSTAMKPSQRRIEALLIGFGATETPLCQFPSLPSCMHTLIHLWATHADLLWAFGLVAAAAWLGPAAAHTLRHWAAACAIDVRPLTMLCYAWVCICIMQLWRSGTFAMLLTLAYAARLLRPRPRSLWWWDSASDFWW